MKLHLDFKPPGADFKINHRCKVLLTGSCFSENIGELLRENRFETLHNPHGIHFNPAGIAYSLRQLINAEDAEEKFFLKRGENYYSFKCHSSIHASTKKELSEKITEINKSAGQFLKKADVLIITFGTAYYYYHLALNSTVVNCHKQALQNFNKLLFQTDEIVSDYISLIALLSDVNPKLKIIFTVSPVKHLRDGIIENNLSKATLLLAASKLTQHFKHCYYFPAYELVSDDLRDYRFYKEDMAHPNQQAIHYVWEKFSNCYFDSGTQKINTLINQLSLAAKHHVKGNFKEEELKLMQHMQNLETEINSLLE